MTCLAHGRLILDLLLTQLCRFGMPMQSAAGSPNADSACIQGFLCKHCETLYLTILRIQNARKHSCVGSHLLQLVITFRHLQMPKRDRLTNVEKIQNTKNFHAKKSKPDQSRFAINGGEIKKGFKIKA